MELSLVIPFYNEEKNVGTVIKTLSKTLDEKKIDYEIIAVDNGSRDSTGKIIDSFSKKSKRIKKTVIKVNKGYGFGIISGLKTCKGRYIGYLWGDNELPIEKTIEVYEILKKENIDLCKVSRYNRGISLSRKIASKAYNLIMWVLFGIRSNDINGCPKIMRAEIYKEINPVSKDWFLDPEIMIKCRRKLFNIKEIPVVSGGRKKGRSNVRWTTVFEFIKNILRYRFSKWE